METLLENGLVAVFVALLLAPFGLPIPEDISLLVAGVLVHWGKAEVWHALVVGYLGVVIGDCFVWTIGRKVGLHPSGLLPRLVGSEKVKRITRFYDRFGEWAIVLCRQVPGLRAPAFFFAGATGIRFTRFLALDGCGAFVTVGLYVWLGITFAENLDTVVPWLDRFRTLGLMVLVIAVGILGIRWVQRTRKFREKASEATRANGSP